MTLSENEAAAHKAKAEKHKQVFDQKKARATREKGLLIVNTGTGKGKTTAAFGMGLRVLGHGMNLGVVQFIKGALATAERDLLANHANCHFHTVGQGYTWNTQDLQQDIETAEAGFAIAENMIASGKYRMVILDELNIVLKYKYLDLTRVLNTLASRPEEMHIVITGRHAPAELIEAADLVSEMKAIKHPYSEQGIKAQAGVEY
ncbi:MAG TPA: cob(I)yrinic acid a,c-diamide adenosyltransferase [Candidatus Obscuribacter sp.]|nr:cob(I)yrinic acid a,c-diamide adenosyltransferase [Candidatus Obscuribacter sp.]HMW89937.1 cob(I)yrinic acid a,c-diamide adenosyltransferase [Candidatus Obscuribacter sp.]HMY53488.1 cob(I)yrinic acid a,c-diamide adenosyltransferase [Candidatus Obscuribacter sp.]HNB14773.1 cob(I)yrinic acid a,c-diamide adenosyltransferase [Candidatus Obscuribacter sp.]HNG17748.1 cob(I)yrinic acid a,c-diamide adenosyltransferase [Candidatus Obscuribacter sp.]